MSDFLPFILICESLVEYISNLERQSLQGAHTPEWKPSSMMHATPNQQAAHILNLVAMVKIMKQDIARLQETHKQEHEKRLAYQHLSSFLSYRTGCESRDHHHYKHMLETTKSKLRTQGNPDHTTAKTCQWTEFGVDCPKSKSI